MDKMKSLLVVGGTGFIGYHIIKEAKKRKWNVTSISLNKPKKKRFHKNVKYKCVDITNYKSLKKKLNKHFDFVVNAGGYGKHPDFNRFGKKLFDSHFLGLVNIVRILLEKKIKKFVQIGSASEYGDNKAPQEENSKCNPNTPYGMAKFSCTNFLQDLYKIKKFPTTTLRFFLVYGPYQDRNRMLPQVIEDCLKNKKFSATKGDQYCDFCFIDDAVEAVFKTFVSKAANGEIINIGTGRPTNIRWSINLIKKLIGKGKPQFGKIAYKKKTNMRVFPDIRKAKKIIGWSPKINFIKGLKLTIRSYR